MKTAFLFFLALVLPASAPAATIQWVHPDKAFWNGGGILDVNHDATPDVVLSAGDRNAAYIGFTPGSPSFLANMGSDFVVPPVPQLLALDGMTGLPLWQIKWDTQDPLPPPPLRERFTLLEGVYTGNIDGAGPNELVVQRSVYKAEPQGDAHGFTLTQGARLYTTMYDPTDGHVIWERQEVTRPDTGLFRFLYRTDVFGMPGAVQTSVSFASVPKYTSTVSVVRFNRTVAPTTLIELPADDDTLTYAIAAPYQGKLRVFLFLQHYFGTVLHVDVRAVDVWLDANGNPLSAQAWVNTSGHFCTACFAPTFWEFPAVVTGGNKPLLIVGEGPLVALDLADGHEVWVSNENAAYLPPGKGRLMASDVNGDGVTDAVFTGWAPLTPSAGLPLVPYVAAVDGRNGSRLWRSLETTGEGWGFSLNLLDVDGDGQKEVAITGSLADAFAFTWTPLEDQGQVSIFDLATGAQRCRYFTERLAFLTLRANLDGAAGDEIVAPALGGVVYSFAGGEPGCTPPPPLPANPVELSSVVSRKKHGDAGNFDVDLPTSGAHGIECRSGGTNGEYTLVFTFSNALDSVNGAAITQGPGTIADSFIDNTDLRRYIVRLSGVTNGPTITVALTNVHDAAGNRSSMVSASMDLLVGDTSNDRAVNSADIGQTKSQSGTAATSSNYREDVTADGVINSADIGLVKSKSGTALP